ncbi:hypothetical protein CEXT_93731 [Caerostris extrusa]|uniref:Uncharacterized protein n=1 Tax=Caerostris extrusa TaxID=172846 RepID=A0AAV4YCK5_CAEEX|nr:hypothetical protein CEXT_93731 [Caerostris extrusa]
MAKKRDSRLALKNLALIEASTIRKEESPQAFLFSATTLHVGTFRDSLQRMTKPGNSFLQKERPLPEISCWEGSIYMAKLFLDYGHSISPLVPNWDMLPSFFCSSLFFGGTFLVETVGSFRIRLEGQRIFFEGIENIL